MTVVLSVRASPPWSNSHRSTLPYVHLDHHRKAPIRHCHVIITIHYISILSPFANYLVPLPLICFNASVVMLLSLLIIVIYKIMITVEYLSDCNTLILN